jgi:hypothetical protein
MHDALAIGAHVVALLSPEYLRSDHCAAQWQNVLASDPLNRSGRLIVLRIVECVPLGWLAGLACWDLVPIRDNSVLLADVRERCRPPWASQDGNAGCGAVLACAVGHPRPGGHPRNAELHGPR